MHHPAVLESCQELRQATEPSRPQGQAFRRLSLPYLPGPRPKSPESSSGGRRGRDLRTNARHQATLLRVVRRCDRLC